jgi:ribosomal protein S27AE
MRRSKNNLEYKEIACEKCGYGYFHTPVEGMLANPKYAICGKCGHQQPWKPGNILKSESAKVSVSMEDKKK